MKDSNDDTLFDIFGLITVEELGIALRRSPKTIRNWVARREIPFVAIKGRTMFRRDSIETWLIQQETKSCR